MAVKEKVRVTVERNGMFVKVTVETEKRGAMTKNLEVDAKVFELVDKRGVSDGLLQG